MKACRWSGDDGNEGGRHSYGSSSGLAGSS
jgi:hypothetical protein